LHSVRQGDPGAVLHAPIRIRRPLDQVDPRFHDIIVPAGSSASEERRLLEPEPCHDLVDALL
jgi:hypothetical protein